MTVPEEKQAEFVEWFKNVAAPTFAKFGAIGHEMYKVEDKPIIGRQVIEKNRFIERVFFEDDFEIPKYFATVKQNPEAWKLSRMYENDFGAKEIELRVLTSIQG